MTKESQVLEQAEGNKISSYSHYWPLWLKGGDVFVVKSADTSFHKLQQASQR